MLMDMTERLMQGKYLNLFHSQLFWHCIVYEGKVITLSLFNFILLFVLFLFLLFLCLFLYFYPLIFIYLFIYLFIPFFGFPWKPDQIASVGGISRPLMSEVLRYWDKFSTSNNRALDKPHWLRYAISSLCYSSSMRLKIVISILSAVLFCSLIEKRGKTEYSTHRICIKNTNVNNGIIVFTFYY